MSEFPTTENNSRPRDHDGVPWVADDSLPATLDFNHIKEVALDHIEDIAAALSDEFNLDGFLDINEFRARNPKRPDDHHAGSFTINVNTGLWKDWADPDCKGGDIISYVAHVRGGTQREAAEWVREHIKAVNGGRIPANGERRPRKGCEPIMPVPPDAPPPPAWLDEGRANVWPYLDGDKNVLFYVHRFDGLNGAKSYFTWFYGRSYETGALGWGKEGFSNKNAPLYGLDRLADAAPEALVIIAEGEKSADAVALLFNTPKVVAVSGKGGAGNAANVDWSPLAGRRVIIWPDCDGPGDEFAKRVMQALLTIGCRVGIVDVYRLAGETETGEAREVEPGWDAADAVAEWGDHKKLTARVLDCVQQLTQPAAATPILATRVCGAGGLKEPNAVGGYDAIGGGVYPANDLIKALNARFHPVRRGGGVWYHMLTPEGAIEAVTEDYLKFAMANLFAEVKVDAPADNSNKRGPKKKNVILDAEGEEVEHKQAWPYWKAHSQRSQIKVPVFKARGEPVAHDEFNDWMGYGVAPLAGEDKVEKLLNHILTVICRNDERKYQYLMDWCAFLVQFPDVPAEVIVALVSEAEGSGKTTLTQALHKIMGGHAMICDNAEMLTGQFTEHLIHCSFLQCEEAFFAGDHKSMDALKSRTTSHVLQINGKFKTPFQGPSHLHIMVTTNHGQVARLGKAARRWVILEVDESRTGDTAYFKAIYDDLNAGGYGQLLNLLKSRDIKGKHPRNIIRTEELAEQQLKSAPAPVQWLLDAVAIGGVPQWNGTSTENAPSEGGFAKDYTNKELYESYIKWRKYTGTSERALANNVFSKVLKKILGDAAYTEHVRRTDAQGKSTDLGRGFLIPDADTLRAKIDEFLGIERSDVP